MVNEEKKIVDIQDIGLILTSIYSYLHHYEASMQWSYIP